ncbi:MAG TPA: IPT/TIG domain-containing protein, partial [Panacibacter sp.]|nr:IPT/TIG domain-containing protein [Panacibacter sp.]
MRKNIFLVLACLFTMQAFSQPTIGSFTPSSGPVGTVVTISGTNFSDNASENIVHIGAVTAVVSAATANSLTVTIPNGTNYQPITVTTNNLTAYSAHPFIVTFDGGGLILSNSFATAVNFTTGNYPLSICLNDFDGDGKEDMGVVNNFPYDSTVSVLRNNGTD